MPATVLSGCPKGGASWSQARKTGPNPMSGGRGSGTTTPSEDAKGGGPEIKGAGCKHTHVTAGTTGTSTGVGLTTRFREDSTLGAGLRPHSQWTVWASAFERGGVFTTLSVASCPVCMYTHIHTAHMIVFAYCPLCAWLSVCVSVI